MNLRLVHAGLLVAALLAALANYEGLSMTIHAETFWQHLFCGAIALGVFSSIAVFWHVAFHVVPAMQDGELRVGALVATGLGALAILGMSAWWTVTALGGQAAQQAAYHDVVAQAEKALAVSRTGNGAFQAMIPSLDALASDIGNLADCEHKSGCVTSVGRSGGVSSLLNQLHDKASAILKAANASRMALARASDRAAVCLTGMRAALSASDSGREKEDDLARQVDCFNGALADIGNVDGGAGIAQALDSFASGIVVPVDIKTDKQREAVQKILGGITERTSALAEAAKGLPGAAIIPPVTMVRLNAMEAVVDHASAVVPAWVTGICLDLGPLVLLLLISIKAMADRARPDNAFQDRTIGDVMVLRRAMAELEPPQAPQLPQRRPTPKGIV